MHYAILKGLKPKSVRVSIGILTQMGVGSTWLSDPNEVSGILNWMLDGLHRINRNKGFSKSKTTIETITEFKRVSDPIGAWLDDNCIFGLYYYIPRKVSHEDYKLYCDNLNVTPETDRKFYERLRNNQESKIQQPTKKALKKHVSG